MQVVAGFLRHQRQARIEWLRLAPAEVHAQPLQHQLQGGLPQQSQLAAMQDAEGLGDGQGQARVFGEVGVEAGVAVAGRIVEGRPQFAPQPVRLQVQHRVGEAAGDRRATVVDLPRFDQEYLAGGAVVSASAAVELLHADLGVADQVAVVPVRIVGVALEMGAQGLDPGLGVAGQVDPVSAPHRASGLPTRWFRRRDYNAPVPGF